MIPELAPFSSPEHQPFSLGQSTRKALLIHGFPGTPAEVRGLAEALHQSGWEVHAPLLPGFGSQIADLNLHTQSEWISFAMERWGALQAESRESMLVGYSMGAAVALHTAAKLPPERLVLISPFWRAPGLYGLVVPLVRRLAPNLRPFKNADFGDPRLQHFFAAIIPEADLGDPRVQDYIRSRFTLPLAAMEEVIRLGRQAYRLAHRIRVETLVVQGSLDQVVQPSYTQRLVRRFREKLVCYHEIQAGHDLLDESSPVFVQFATRVVDFAGSGCSSITRPGLTHLELQHT